MKRRQLKHKKSPEPIAPNLFRSPLVQGLLNLIPLFVVISLVGINFSTQDSSQFKNLALMQGDGLADPSPLVLAAASENDYSLAQSLFTTLSQQTKVLGASTDLELIVFPELALEKEVAALQPLANIHPSRSLFLKLAVLEWRLNRLDRAWGYLDLARSLDPNDPALAWAQKTLLY